MNGTFTGMNATGELRAITGNAMDVLRCDSQHVWPYGLNYVTEAGQRSYGRVLGVIVATAETSGPHLAVLALTKACPGFLLVSCFKGWHLRAAPGMA
jgi:hypothetical protein